ncbi:MAG: hypoxanthine phosphoribosyltransferase [Oscillospiraceae bacterium]|jgi:hypoxanthine phosphoribosyltransferase|nr:hypoxanthine phosphoribosyltransferase [Oscillospiraceae bacterium]
MRKDIERVLFTEAQIAERVREMGARIGQDYAGKELLLVSVLKGSVVFLSDLMREIPLPVKIDFMAVSSYGKGHTTSGTVNILKDVGQSVEGKDVLIVEDILDSGVTLRYIMDLMEARNPASLRLCVLLDKPERRVVPVECHYTGFTAPDAFIVGYGLDYAERYRNLPYIGALYPFVYN